jgi:hypothetical protein
MFCYPTHVHLCVVLHLTFKLLLHYMFWLLCRWEKRECDLCFLDARLIGVCRSVIEYWMGVRVLGQRKTRYAEDECLASMSWVVGSLRASPRRLPKLERLSEAEERAPQWKMGFLDLWFMGMHRFELESLLNERMK